MGSFIFAVLLLVAPIAVLSQNSQFPNNIRDPCRNFECQNGGYCSAPADAPFCVCRNGYTGDRCQYPPVENPGTCPKIKPGDVSVCGAAFFCSSDSECKSNQKCCQVPCGQKECTTVDNIRDPCRNFECQNGGYCSAPADAPFCVCRNGYTGDRCQTPPVENPGTCPQIKPGDVSVCGAAFFCSSDSECRSNQKCCRVPCGQKECTTVESPENTLTCATVLCITNTTCRHVKEASGIVVPRCLPIGTVGQDIDDQCRRRNYSEVILIQNPSNSSAYSPLTCSSSSSYTSRSTCPSDSVCISDRSGRGVCCRGSFGTVTPRVKPGVCPRQITSCSRKKSCNNDYDCTGEQKCCRSCGLNVCANPDPSVVQCGDTYCARGELCVERTPCAPGMICAQVVRPVCVPKACENCSTDRCVKLGTGHRCLPPRDSCGGCSPGQVCIFTGVVCVKAPCPWSYKCVKNNTCGGCRDGYVCQESSNQCIQTQ